MFIYILYERSLKKDALKRMPFIISAWTFSCQWLNTKVKQNKTKHQTTATNTQQTTTNKQQTRNKKQGTRNKQQ